MMGAEADTTIEASTLADQSTGHGCDGHIVQFYEDEEYLYEVVGEFLSEGLTARQPVIVVATAAHRAAFVGRLAAAGIDVDALRAAGRFVLLDARETLSRFMVAGRPDPELFESFFVGAIEQLQRGTDGGPFRAYGEMVDLLWRDGNPSAAIQLEELWNTLGRRHSFSLLCAYVMGSFRREEAAGHFEQICRTHTRVVPTEDFSRLDDAAKLREIAVLQQRARALETEVERRREIEAALLEALRTRDEFLSIAGHELKTPLTALQLQLQSLFSLVSRESDPRLGERVGKATRSVERLSSLVVGLLDVSRMSEGRFAVHPTEVDLSAVVRDAVERASEPIARASCPVRVVAPDTVRGCWDPERLEQVVANLLSNALKYGEGRPIEITVEDSGEVAQLVVRDEGIGIPAADQARIFERFERAASARNFGGLGLGLWIVRRIVEAHGGTIRVESAPGLGTTFTVELPVAPAVAAVG